MNKFQDVELLSSYLDGQLSPSDSARLESRLASDAELASALSDLRAARSILRKLPARKAPRNFMLTRKMVGVNPPLPRTYSFFRFSSAFAAALLVFTFAFNILTQGIGLGAAAPLYGFGGGGSSDTAAPQTFVGAAATEAPAAAQAPALELSAIPTETLPSSADSARKAETATAEAANSSEPAIVSSSPSPAAVQHEPFVFSLNWQVGLLIIGLLSAAVAFGINQSAKRKWR